MVCAVDQLTPMRTNCMPMSQQSGSDNPGRYVGKLVHCRLLQDSNIQPIVVEGSRD